MEIPLFNVTHENRLIDVERFFEVMKIPENKKINLVSVRLKAATSVWWE